MAGYQPARSGALETMEDFYKRRQREVSHLGEEAAAAARDAYTGGGHHYLPQRTRLPPALGGGPVPSFISDGPFFLLKPEGISTGDMYELHYNVDPKYGGGKIPAEFGGGRWSGDELEWEKHDQLGQLWHGAPVPLKALAGSGVVGAGALVDQIDNNEQN